MNKKLIIAIDGPAGSGKSTTAKLLAKKLNYNYIDTGAMYRAVTYFALNSNIPPSDEAALESLLNKMEIEFIKNGEEILVNNQNISKEIRQPIVSENVSDYSKVALVRKILVKKQQEMGKDGGIVMEGRDISTVVFPNADLKIFLTADLSVRANRRKLELNEKGIGLEIKDVENNLKKRDEIDSSREISPLKLAEDAIIIDTTYLTIDEQVNKIYEIALNKIKERDF